MKIRFDSSHPSGCFEGGRIDVRVSSVSDAGESTEQDVYFTVPTDFHAHNDCVATCLLTLCGRKYTSVDFNFPISPLCADRAKRRCALDSIGPVDPALAPRQAGAHLGLNFSGGFDSLAAHQVLSGAAKRISTDFGGAFQRETDFFTSLHPDMVCTTDFRQKGFGLNDWSFMGAASVLLADYLDLGQIAFGAVLEATPWNLRCTAPVSRCTDGGVYAAASLEEVSIVRGLTEFGTTMIVMGSCPQLIESSLASLASTSSEKLFRKKLILKHLYELAGRPVPEYLVELALPRQRIEWGQSFAVDFLSLYFVKHFGIDFVRQFVPGIEQVDLTPLEPLSLDFYRKWNPNFAGVMPEKFQGGILREFSRHGICPYDETDWFEFEQVRKFIAAARPKYWTL